MLEDSVSLDNHNTKRCIAKIASSVEIVLDDSLGERFAVQITPRHHTFVVKMIIMPIWSSHAVGWLELTMLKV